MKYGFIGLGNMATAIIGGMVKSGEFSEDIIMGFDIAREKSDIAEQQLGITVKASASDLCAESDVIVIAVKPQVIDGVLADIKQSVGDKLIISIAAGKTVSFLENALGEDKSIIRVMPNINASVCAATSAYTCNACVLLNQKSILEKIFSTVGTITELPEKLFSAFTAIAGSSPAFAYLYIDALARAGVKHGMTKQKALEIAASTVFGSAKMIMQSDLHPMELVDRVCSPAGTTIEGILSLQKSGFEASIHEAVNTVVEKDKKL